MEDYEITSKPIDMGYCAHCGDGVLVGEFNDQDAADVAATERCTCKDATRARKAAEKAAAEEEDPPEVKIEKAHAYIDDCFDDVDEESQNMLKAMATLLVEGKSKRFNAIIDDSVSATLFKRANGRVSIERKDWTSARAEI